MSVSFGTRALFKWNGQSCPDSDASSCWLDHGDLLVMDGHCQDEFLHCTNPGSEQERIDITFRWIRQHVASCPLKKRTGVACCVPTCAQGLVERCVLRVLGAFGDSVCIWEVLALLVFPLMSTGSGYAGVPIAGHAFGQRSVGGGITFVVLCEFTGFCLNALGEFWVVATTTFVECCIS